MRMMKKKYTIVLLTLISVSSKSLKIKITFNKFDVIAAQWFGRMIRIFVPILYI